MGDVTKQALSKVPAVTLGFWVIKILATTLGETGGDTVTMTLNWGYLAGVALFAVALVALRCRADLRQAFPSGSLLGDDRRLDDVRHDAWPTSPTDRSGSATRVDRFCCCACVLATLGLWRWSAGTVSVDTVTTPKVEGFYWATITFSQTLGTALGDWLADTGGIGYERGALVFSAGLAVVAALYFWTSVSRVTLFWVAFILTRPLGATVGDFLDKPVSHGGLDVSRPLASAVIAALIVAAIIVLPQRPGQHPGEQEGSRAGLAVPPHRPVGTFGG